MSTPSDDRQRAADSLVTIAIAALDQVVPLSGTVGAAVLRHLLSKTSRSARVATLDEKAAREVRTWAKNQGIQESVEPGLLLAERALRDHGATRAMLEEEHYDADKVAARVLDAVRAAPIWSQEITRWGKEDRHVVAERGIRVAYDTLIAGLQTEAPSVTDLATIGRRLDEISAGIRDLQRSANPTGGQVIDYLTTRLRDWDRPVWGTETPITLSRRLRLFTPPDEDPARSRRKDRSGDDAHNMPEGSSSINGLIPEDLSDVEALAKHRMLVVLAGPGSGKTWLARSYAREAARRAIERFANGADTRDVEIPLLVTWDQWARSLGGPRESLVEAAFTAGSGHSATIHDAAIKELLLEPATQVLLIVDSLDEAADQQGQANRLHELASLLPSWRVVVTSRHAAWERAATTFLVPEGLRVMELQGLSYPDDVDAFVTAWFKTGPSKAAALLDQIHTRHELAQPASSPLLLTIYCLLTQHDPEAGLPTRRHQLYDALTRQLLERRDKDRGLNASLRYRQCAQVLGQWAWHAVGTSDDPYSGLGNWGDTFTAPDESDLVDVAILDEIAPRIGEAGPIGPMIRRFIHRSLLEHFVAQYVSTLDANSALEVLLPHIWFDPDWQTAAPAAVAAHNRAQRGELFELISASVALPSKGSSNEVRAGDEIDRFLLAVADESDPDEWDPDHRALFNECRTRNAERWPHRVARSAHWRESNAKVLEQVVDRIAAYDLEAPRSEIDLEAIIFGRYRESPGGEDLAALAQTDRDRDLLREMMASRFESTAASGRLEFLIAMVGAGLVDESGRRALVGVLSDVRRGFYGDYEFRRVINEFPGVLVAVARSEAESARLARLLRDDLSVYHALHVVRGMQLLERAEPEVEQLRCDLIRILQAHKHTSKDFAIAIQQVGLSLAQRDQVAEMILATMDQVSKHASEAAAREARTLARINPTSEHRDRARSILVRLLVENTRARKARDIVRALVRLGPTLSERRRAIECILPALGHAGDVGDEMLEAFALLEPTVEDMADARRQVLHILNTANHRFTDDAARWLVGLDPSQNELSYTRSVLLDRLGQNLIYLDQNVSALLALSPTQEDLARARWTVLDALDVPDSHRVISRAGTLARLGPTSEERARARERLWAIGGASANWLDAFYPLDPTHGERERVRDLMMPLGANPSDDEFWLRRCRQASTPGTWLDWTGGK